MLTYTNPTRYDVRRDLVIPTGTPIVKSPYWFTNLMVAHLQGRNM